MTDIASDLHEIMDILFYIAILLTGWFLMWCRHP